MKVTKWIYFLIFVLVYCNCSILQDPYEYEILEDPINRSRTNFKPSGEEDACFAQSLMPNIYEMRTKEYMVFTGDEKQEEVDIIYRKIIVEQKRLKWNKSKMPNCRSYNEEDCLAWCISEQPEKIEKLKFNELPVGHLDLETLEILGVEVE